MIMQDLRELFRSMDIDGVTPTKKLEDDLGMDSQERLCFREDLEQRLHVIMDDNELTGELAVQELAAIISAKRLELPAQSGFDGRLVEDVVIGVPPGRVRQALFDVSAWPEKLPHVRSIRISYDDGRYQEFAMDVDGADGKLISVRSVRRCDNDHIVFFQPQPPRFLRHHCGDWFIRELDENLTHLTTAHRWNLSAGADGTKVDALLREHARFALDTWRQILEGTAA